MGLGFFPNAARMYKEIEQWAILGKVDTLMGLCNCCVYKVFDFILAPECRSCSVRKAILWIAEMRGQDIDGLASLSDPAAAPVKQS